MLFVDLIGFTTLSEHRDPEAVRELTSDYFDHCRTLIEHDEMARTSRCGVRHGGVAPWAPARRIGFAIVLGLPDAISACLFDLDGVLTQTAKVHAEAWKQTFDEYLRRRADRGDEPFREFDKISDYDEYVDGRPRYDGVRSFLASRQIKLPEGDPTDLPSKETICGIGNRKNDLVLRLIAERGVEPYDGSVAYVKAARQQGLRRAVVSSSANCKDILVAAGIDELFEVRIDGIVADEQHLRGKPAPDTFLAGARALGVEPARAVVFEDALAGVQAGREGGFGYVVGVDRVGQAAALREHGASVVVTDLGELLDHR